LKSALSKVWAFAPENEEEEMKKPAPEIESLEGKMSVAPDGKEKKPETIDQEEGQEEQEKE
jgi:hypothetical protein